MATNKRIFNINLFFKSFFKGDDKSATVVGAGEIEENVVCLSVEQ